MSISEIQFSGNAVRLGIIIIPIIIIIISFLFFRTREIKLKVFLWVILAAISVWFFLPAKESLFKNGILNPDSKDKFNFSVISPKFQSTLQQIGLPAIIKPESYNLSLSNLSSLCSLSYALTFSESDPLIPYFEKELGPAITTVTIDHHPGFEVQAGDGPYLIKNIPFSVPMSQPFGSAASYINGELNKEGFLSVCPLNNPCELLNLYANGFQVIASPNFNGISLLIQILLILAFWLVVINNVYTFFK